ncbi:MAG: oligosaccharide flippase family protein [Clostridiales bacterium]|nr:oligosaccharide flippase family protein [Clostridiales bacterium]
MINRIITNLKVLWQKGALYIVIGSFATKFVTLFGSIFIVRLLSKDEYGVLSYVENLYSFVLLIAGFGLSNAVLRYVVLGNDLSEKKKYYKYINNRSWVYNIIISIVFIVSAFIYPHPAEFTNSSLFLALMLVMLPFQYNVENNLATERAMFQNRRFAVYSFIVSTVVVLGKVFGAFIGNIGSIIAVTVAIYMAGGAVTTSFVKKRYFKNIKEDKIDKKQKKEINIYSFQYMITNGLWTLFMISDVFLLSKLGCSPDIIADYKIAYVWPANVGIICSAIAVFVTPYFVRNEKNKVWVRTNFIKVYLVNLGVVLIIGGFLCVLAKPLIYVYAGAKYMNTINLMRIILIGALINNGLRMITANTLSAMGQVKYNMVVSLIGVVLQISINIVVIPKFGTYGVACTSIFVYTLMAIILFFIFARKYDLFKRTGIK